ncbi:MAG: hypothetical protein J6112_03090 [Clostridia bacterium]|nr:hypothetical protein [Clostridia bacterium]
MKRSFYGKRAAGAVSVLLCALALVLVFSGCTDTNKPGPSDFPDIDPISSTEEPVEMRDLTNDTKLADSVVLANQAANGVQARYVAGTDRSKYEIYNKQLRIVESLDTDGKLGIESISERNGGTYLTNSMYSYVVDKNGTVWSDNYSTTVGRINTTRLGYYYYEVFLRDQGFGTKENGSYKFDQETSLSIFDNDWLASSHCSVSYDKGKSVTMLLTKGLDPYIARYFETPVPKSKATHLAITIAAEGSAGRSQLFLFDKQTRDFNAEQMIDFELSCDGKPHTYVLEIGDKLKDDLMGIRIDAGKIPGEKYTVYDVRAVTVGECICALGEKTLDVYPDKVHQSFRLLARKGYEEVEEFGMIWEMPVDKVEEIRIRDYNDAHSDTNIDPGSVQYVAFKVKDAGVVAIIIPDDGSTLKTTVTLEDGKYVVKQIAAGPLKLKAGRSCYFGHRIYTDPTGNLDSVDGAAWKERNPIPAENFVVNSGSSNAKINGYDTLKGYYKTTVNGTIWPNVFPEPHRNDYFISDITVNADYNDRDIYICVTSYPGTLECAVLLDGDEMQVPIPMQVCKNFDCEKEEKVYDPEDLSFSNSIFPLAMKSGSSVTFKDVHLYVNWGKFQIKQLSSIQFFVSYYHLSTGCSESNCISFYGVFGKDGFLLPDFRGHSGIRWEGDPQFTSVATSKATSYYDNDGKLVMNEYLGSKINSSGPSYADLEYSYIADSGAFKYSIRHTEFPQTDENRTYSVIDLEFLKDLTLNDVRKQFTLLYQDSRSQYFAELSYMDPDGNRQHVDLVTKTRDETYYTINSKQGWYAYYHSNKPVPMRVTGEDDPMNYAVVIKDTDITIGGKKWEGNFILRDSFGGSLNFSSLTLDLGKTTFKKGDRIYIEFLMLPWANRDLTSDENILLVFEDSVKKPLTVTEAKKGTILDEPYLARVLADANEAEFTVTGGRNRNVVRVDGFTALVRPTIEIIDAAGNATLYETKVKDYDGYAVHLGRDGTYSYSFVYEAESPDETVTFRVTAK